MVLRRTIAKNTTRFLGSYGHEGHSFRRNDTSKKRSSTIILLAPPSKEEGQLLNAFDFPYLCLIPLTKKDRVR